MTTDPSVITWGQVLDEYADVDDLFHIPTDEVQERRMDAGLSWMTLCGEIRPPAREIRDFTDEPDECVVCVDIEAES